MMFVTTCPTTPGVQKIMWMVISQCSKKLNSLVSKHKQSYCCYKCRLCWFAVSYLIYYTFNRKVKFYFHGLKVFFLYKIFGVCSSSSKLGTEIQIWSHDLQKTMLAPFGGEISKYSHCFNLPRVSTCPGLPYSKLKNGTEYIIR